MKSVAATLFLFVSFSHLIHAADPKNHPSAQVAVDYLKAVHVDDWDKAVKLIDKESLKNLHALQVRYLYEAPTMEAEDKLLEVLGVEKIADLEKLSPEEIFIRRGKARTMNYTDPEKRRELMRKTLKMNVLGTITENPSLVHIFIRKDFEADKGNVSMLEVAHTVMEDKVWKVSLDAQEPLVTELKAERDPVKGIKPGVVTQVALDYVQAVDFHEWEKAATMIDQESLANLKKFQLKYLEPLTAGQRDNVLRTLGASSVEDVEKMTPAQIFARRGYMKTRQLLDPKEHVAKLKETIDTKILGSVTENPTLVHVAIRKQFAARELHISELAIASVVKDGANWKISLDAQEPNLTEK